MEGIPKKQIHHLSASTSPADMHLKKVDNALIIMNDLIVIEVRLRIIKKKIGVKMQFLKQIDEAIKRNILVSQRLNDSQQELLTLHQCPIEPNLFQRLNFRLCQKLEKKHQLYTLNRKNLQFLRGSIKKLLELRDIAIYHSNNLQAFVEILSFISRQNNILKELLMQLIVSQDFVSSVQEFQNLVNNIFTQKISIEPVSEKQDETQSRSYKPSPCKLRVSALLKRAKDNIGKKNSKQNNGSELSDEFCAQNIQNKDKNAVGSASRQPDLKNIVNLPHTKILGPVLHSKRLGQPVTEDFFDLQSKMTVQDEHKQNITVKRRSNRRSHASQQESKFSQPPQLKSDRLQIHKSRTKKTSWNASAFIASKNNSSGMVSRFSPMSTADNFRSFAKDTKILLEANSTFKQTQRTIQPYKPQQQSRICLVPNSNATLVKLHSKPNQKFGNYSQLAIPATNIAPYLFDKEYGRVSKSRKKMSQQRKRNLHRFKVQNHLFECRRLLMDL